MLLVVVSDYLCGLSWLFTATTRARGSTKLAVRRTDHGRVLQIKAWMLEILPAEQLRRS